MGSNGAWVVKNTETEREVFVRRQMGTPRNKRQIERLMKEVAKRLMGPQYIHNLSDFSAEEIRERYGDISEYEIGQMGVLIKEHLEEHVGQLSNALIRCVSKSTKEFISPDLSPGIETTGLFEIEVEDWNLWHINHYTVKDEVDEESKVKVATVEFEEGKNLEEGFNFEWLQDDDWNGRYR